MNKENVKKLKKSKDLLFSMIILVIEGNIEAGR